MLFRRQVIAPMGQGSDDFLDHTDAYRYASGVEPAYLDVAPAPRVEGETGFAMQTCGAGGLNAHCTWQVPSLDALRWHLRNAATHGPEALQILGDRSLSQYGYAAVARTVIDEMERVVGH